MYYVHTIGISLSRDICLQPPPPPLKLQTLPQNLWIGLFSDGLKVRIGFYSDSYSLDWPQYPQILFIFFENLSPFFFPTFPQITLAGALPPGFS